MVCPPHKWRCVQEACFCSLPSIFVLGSSKVAVGFFELFVPFDQNLPSPVAQRVKRLPEMQETQVLSLGQEDTLEKETATHSITLAWKIPWTEETGRL